MKNTQSIPGAVTAVALGMLCSGIAAACEDSTILVSGYNSDNVHLYDACDGTSLGILDPAGRIRGAQAVHKGPDGLLYVVSEKNNKILRYDRETFAFVDEFIADNPATANDELGGMRNPTGLTFTPDGDVLVAGYSSDSVSQYSGEDGSWVRNIINAGASGLNGPDAGLWVGPDGLLYVPSYDANRVMVFDLDGNYQRDLASAPNVNQPRVITPGPNGNVLISSYGSSEVRQYRLSDGDDQGVLISTAGPTGVAWLGDTILVASDLNDRVRQYDTDGVLIQQLTTPGSGGINGATFIHVIQPEEAMASDLLWLTGAAVVAGNSVEFGEVVITSGGEWGAGHDAANIIRTPWGSVTLTMTKCDKLIVAFASTVDGYGSGQRAASRDHSDPNWIACNAAGGPGANPDPAWFAGVWSMRDSEGLLLKHFGSGLIGLGLFSYVPK